MRKRRPKTPQQSIRLAFRGGKMLAIHSDALQRSLKPVGALTIKRASHVEPDSAGKWHADMSPMSGPILGPFAARRTALRAEVAWLNRNVI